MSAFTQEELSLIIRKVKPIPYKQNPTVLVFKDKLFVVKDKKGIVYFHPQRFEKLLDKI